MSAIQINAFNIFVAKNTCKNTKKSYLQIYYISCHRHRAWPHPPWEVTSSPLLVWPNATYKGFLSSRKACELHPLCQEPINFEQLRWLWVKTCSSQRKACFDWFSVTFSGLNQWQHKAFDEDRSSMCIQQTFAVQLLVRPKSRRALEVHGNGCL